MARAPWWKDGIRFECQQSGKCCVSRGNYGYVYVTPQDRKRFAAHFKMTTRKFTETYCMRTGGYYHLKETPDRLQCMFFKNGGCTVYDARPTQCRTWPFWPDHMSPKAWALEVASFCPGVGKGKLHTESEIREQMERQKASEENL